MLQVTAPHKLFHQTRRFRNNQKAEKRNQASSVMADFAACRAGYGIGWQETSPDLNQPMIEQTLDVATKDGAMETCICCSDAVLVSGLAPPQRYVRLRW